MWTNISITEANWSKSIEPDNYYLVIPIIFVGFSDSIKYRMRANAYYYDDYWDTNISSMTAFIIGY